MKKWMIQKARNQPLFVYFTFNLAKYPLTYKRDCRVAGKEMKSRFPHSVAKAKNTRRLSFLVKFLSDESFAAVIKLAWRKRLA